MNAAVKLSKNATKVLDGIAESGAFFDVKAEEVYLANGTAIRDRVAVTRADTGECVGLVGRKYKIVTNEEVFTSFVHSLDRSGLDLAGATIDTSFSWAGARTFSQIVLPAHQFTVGDSADTQAIRIIAKNAYDGSTKFNVQAGAYRFVCTNGMVFGDRLASYASKHTHGLDLKVAADSVAMVLETAMNAKDKWEKMIGVKCTPAQAYYCFALASRNVKAAQEGMPKEYEDWSPAMRKMMDIWTNNSQILGLNAWALFNSLTEFATHWGSRSKDNEATSRDLREQRIIEMMSMPRVKKILTPFEK